MSFGEHLEELRWRLIRALVAVGVGTVVAFAFSEHVMAFLVRPLVLAMRNRGLSPTLLALQPTEVFVVVLKMSLLTGLIISAPYALYQIWAFVAAGLYPHERRWVTRIFPISVGLFAGGVAFLFYIVLPLVLNFLIGTSQWVPFTTAEPNAVLRRLLPGTVPTTRPAAEDATDLARLPVLSEDPVDPPMYSAWINGPEGRLKVYLGQGRYFTADLQSAERRALVQPGFALSYYISFVTNLALGFGLGFQVPLVVVFLSRVGLVSASEMASGRRYVILLSFVAAAVLTPPDVASQVLLAVPIIVLFEAGLLAARLMERRRA